MTVNSPKIVPQNILSQLKCALCESYLSVPPINLISDDGSQFKCGRCSSIKTIISIRATIYESLAKLMTFPCSFPDCDKKIAFIDVKDHEKNCEHKTIICPKSACNDTIKVQKIASHFKEKHSDTYHQNTFLIKNINAYYNIDVLERNGKTFIGFFDFDDVNFGLSICSVDPCDTSSYEIKLKSEKSNFAITISNQNVILFNEREHCFKCVSSTCKSKFHIFKDNRKEIAKRMTTKINRDCVKRMFASGLITYSINIVDDIKEEKNIKEESKVEDAKDIIIRKAKKILLQSLECPICKEYMSPPIYLCLTGHTICNDCKVKLEKCPNCEEFNMNTRNYALEELSRKVELPINDKKVKNEVGTKRGSDQNGSESELPSAKVQKS